MRFLRSLAVVALAYLLGFAAFMLTLERPAAPARTDAIVVLTGGAGRIPRGLQLMEDGMARRMLISGADATVRPRELAAEYGVSRRLFACCIDLGYEAVDTRSNAEETARWLMTHHYTSVRLVTAEWHMHRARMELVAALPAPIEVVGDAVPSNPPISMLVREYNNLVRRVALWIGYR
jgi:uncharacterized SAM-binding protein YcdF (DUF218 family)